jgi:hypothetical protein
VPGNGYIIFPDAFFAKVAPGVEPKQQNFYARVAFNPETKLGAAARA